MHIPEHQIPFVLLNLHMAYLLYPDTNISEDSKAFKIRKENKIITQETIVATKLVYRTYIKLSVLEKMILHCTYNTIKGSV